MAFGFVNHLLHGNSDPGGGVFGYLQQHVEKPVVEQGSQALHGLNTSPAANIIRLGAANVTDNPQARQNASKGLHMSFLKAGEPYSDPRTAGINIAGSLSGNGLRKGEAPTVISRHPTESPELSGAVKSGKLQPTGDTAPTHSLELGSDTKGIKLDQSRVNYYKNQIEQGITIDPIVINNKGQIQDGAHRFEAMKQLGVTHVPVVEEIPKKPLSGAAQQSVLGKLKSINLSDESGYIRIPGRGETTVPEGQHNLSSETSVPHIIDTPSGEVHIAKPEMDRLIKATSTKEVKSIIGDSLPPEVVDRLSIAIPRVKDPNTISNLIKRELGPKVPPPIQDVLPPTPPIDEFGDKQRKFLETVQNSDNSTPELVAGAKELQQNYKQKANQELIDKATQAVEKDHPGELSRVLASDNLSDSDVATGIVLMRKAQSAGTKEGTQQAVNIADHLDKQLREAGRTVQAASIWDNLSPEGVLQLAAKRVGKAREGKKNFSKEQPTAEEIKQTIENSVPGFDKGSVQQAIKDISNDQQKLDLGGLEGPAQAVENTGQKLARNVEKAATPAVKKKVDTLVAELTKKVKQEQLLPKTVTKKSPLSILQEVFGRNAEAKEAYPLAQKILQEKYKNVPQMQEALDKFFKSKLDIPAAESTLKGAINDQLKLSGEKVSDIIYKSLTTQEATVKNVANDLVKEGFDPQSAAKLGEEVAKRLNKQVVDAKKSALERLGAEAKPRNQTTYQEKINKLSNIGALDEQDYLHIARAKLDLPQLSEGTASKLHELSQNLQDMPEGHDKYAAVREIQQLIADEIPKSKSEKAAELAGLPRTILASGDFSFGGRQALVYATSHPIKFLKAWPKQFEYFKQAFKGSDSEAYDAMMADIRNNKYYGDLEKDLSLQEPHGHSTTLRQEQFASSELAEKIPALGRLVRASNYAYTGLANYLKANQYYAWREHLDYAGIKPTEEMRTQMAEVIDTSLGRGGKKGGFTEKHAGALSTGLFAPRLMSSRLNVLNPAYYIRLEGPARQEALRGLLGLSAFATGVLGAAKLAGAQVSLDPHNSDFGKIRVGDTRFDPLGGFTQYIRLGVQLASGKKINSETGAETEAGKGFAGSRLDIASNFIQGKENPTASFVTTMLKGKDINGNSIYNAKGVTKEVAQRFIPLIAQDLADLASHPNSPGVKGIIPAAFGVGVQTYGKQDNPITDKQKTYLEALKKQGAGEDVIKANNDFFQNLKTASGTRANVSEQINAALEKKDFAKAQQLADAYNKKLSQGMTEWAQQYGEKYGSADLQTAYNQQKLNLTAATVKSRIKAQQSVKPY